MGDAHGGPLTPTELAQALDALDRVVAGGGTDEELLLARAALPIIRGLLRDVRSGPDDVTVGRQVPFIRPSATLMKLQVLAPPGALDGILRWIEGQAGTRGRRERDFTAVTEDGGWTQLQEHQPPVVYEQPKRRAVR